MSTTMAFAPFKLLFLATLLICPLIKANSALQTELNGARTIGQQENNLQQLRAFQRWLLKLFRFSTLNLQDKLREKNEGPDVDLQRRSDRMLMTDVRMRKSFGDPKLTDIRMRRGRNLY